jgi:hypothetical protein
MSAWAENLGHLATDQLALLRILDLIDTIPLGWLEPYRRLWEQRLDALEAHLDRKAIREHEED